jgi:DNA-binding transcriptional ArsR family regulator
MAQTFHFTQTDLGKIRFAFSPLWECVSSLRVLRDPGLGAMHLPWIKEAKHNTKHLDLEPLLTLVRDPKEGNNYIPDFLTPPPTTPFPDLQSELFTMCQTPHNIVQRDIELNYQDLANIPKSAKPFLTHPQQALDTLSEQLQSYWAATLEPHWGRLRLLLESDVMLRARQLALGGAGVLFSELHHSLSFVQQPDQAHLIQAKSFEHEVHLAGRGLVLVPSAFLSHKIMSMHLEPWQPTLIYPARGSANLWSSPLEPSVALEALLGHGCAKVFEALRVPTGTLELAKRLQVAPGNVSHHLKRLVQAGLLESHRQGRVVYYRHSSRAETLLGLYKS